MEQPRRNYLIEAATEGQPYPPEAKLAAAWLESNIDNFDDIDFQKRVGPGVELGPEYHANIQAMAYQATRKRVDLVGYSGDAATIVEFKDHVDLAAVRQALNYAQLWAVDPGTPPVSAVLVVGNTGDADIVNTAEQLGVTVELLPQAPPSTPTP